MYTTLSYRFPEDRKVEKLGIAEIGKRGGGGSKSKNITTEFEWFAFQQQFFSSIMIAPEGFSNGLLGFDTYQPGSGYIKDYKASVSVPFDENKEIYNFKFYFGPNKFSLLKGYGLGLEKIVQLGGKLVSWVNRSIVIPVFDFLSKYIGSYGLIILLLTLFIKLLIFPLTYKSYLSSAKMRALKPELSAIQAKYPKAQTDQNEMMKSQQATMELYKKYGVSPMGGCLPMLIQMPILIAMFRFFPASIELRGKSFLWSDDLSSYDSILDLPFNIPFYGDHISLFCLLMVVVLFGYSYMNYKQTAATQPAMPGMKFMTVYMMPIMMLFWFNDYSSGLCYYYLLSNIITMLMMFGIRMLVDDDKVRASINRKMTNTKGKKSRFQQRYEELMRQQEQLNKQQR
jgi:YidC/Oxa1 family membrane protein insertase